MLERLYLKSPVAIQNMMVGGYGMLLYRRRVASRTHKKLLQEIAGVEALDTDEVRALQGRLLRRTLVHAARTVPHYRKLFSHLALDPERQDPNVVLASLPVLSSAELKAAPAQFLSSATRNRYSIHTSGTTGSPMTVRCTRAALLRNYAHFYRLRQRLEIGRRDRCATFAGRTIVEPDRSKPPFWRRNIVTNTILYSTYHISINNVMAYVEQMAKQDPILIDSYPSALGIISQALMERPDLRVRPRAIITSSETLLAHQRSAAETAFDCRVTDQYGSAEMSAFAAQCQRGRYHVWATYGMCEVLVDGRPARPGEAGDLVATGFINDSMPLVRYATGDTAVMGDGCDCGLNFPTLERIEGRKDDVLVAPDGRQVGRLDPVFKGLPDDAFREVQIVQTEPAQVVLRFVPGSRFTDDSVSKVELELAKRLGSTVQIIAQRVATLPRGPNGKLRAVVGLEGAESSKPV